MGEGNTCVQAYRGCECRGRGGGERYHVFPGWLSSKYSTRLKLTRRKERVPVETNASSQGTLHRDGSVFEFSGEGDALDLPHPTNALGHTTKSF